MKDQYVIALALFFLLGGLAPTIEHQRSRGAVVQIPAEIPRTFAGSVARQGDNFYLNDPANKVIYMLGNAKTASTYLGKKVRITGALDLSQNTLRMDRIDIIG